MATENLDQKIRQRAFDLLVELSDRFGEVLPFQALRKGFEFEGIRVPLLGPQGIFKPRLLEIPLSITTAPNGPYDDSFSDDGLLRYRYRGTDVRHRDNVGLREAMRLGKPLIYLHGVVKGRYVPAWPVYVVDDDPGNLTFTVAVDDLRELSFSKIDAVQEPIADIRRRYVTSAVRVRLHQRTFRERVLEAYRQQCALCRLRHVELLEAAHITPDSDPEGEPVVSNGLALCKLHHAAFDRNILGIRPDYVVEIRVDILEEIDGPMLKHGLQEMHGSKLVLPRRKEHRPDQAALEVRYAAFRDSTWDNRL